MSTTNVRRAIPLLLTVLFVTGFTCSSASSSASDEGVQRSASRIHGYYVGQRFESCYYEIDVQAPDRFRLQALDALAGLFRQPPFLKDQQALSAVGEQIQVVSASLGANPSAVILRNRGCDKVGLERAFGLVLGTFRPFMASGMGSAGISETSHAVSPAPDERQRHPSSGTLEALRARFALHQAGYRIEDCIVGVDASSSLMVKVKREAMTLMRGTIRDYRFPMLDIGLGADGKMHVLLYDHCDAGVEQVSSLLMLVHRARPDWKAIEWKIEPERLERRAMEKAFR